ncbi:uncharacterized protein F4807DRAFT_469174 [Annulohypoxylon truncatum]|uniref:uncharacterized protein n=1 Tax=Annulohypoxylon truncatum TaxID=327061 RepID=UPI0020081423|nr:uncharacterized protein F4807DRAFT_469174 [Annulohypoxylon truncatum]KAI1207660.1 hypothetical protein F4807DRAFT_469174 [Annulohypoxylon truncatum]
MADIKDNGTLLARQMRRFIERNPEIEFLQDVPDSAKASILQLGDPDFYQDKSEEAVPIPLELSNRRTFQSLYKRLQKEYLTLPNLKSQDMKQDKKKEEGNAKGHEKDDKEQEGEDQETSQKNPPGTPKNVHFQRPQDAIPPTEDVAFSQGTSSQGTSRQGTSSQGTSSQGTSSQGTSSQSTSSQGPGETNHDIGGAGETTAESTSGRSSGEPSAEAIRNQDTRGETPIKTEDNWSTRGSSAETSGGTAYVWRKLNEALLDDGDNLLKRLSERAQQKDCDFSDVKFYLEYQLNRNSDLTKEGLSDLAIKFIDHCPQSQADLCKSLSENDPQLKRRYDKYYASTNLSPEIKQRRAWARNPQAYRERMFEGLRPDKQGWDQITLKIDPDTGKKNTKGRITASIDKYLDVCLDSLKRNDEERHYLALRSEYPLEAERFEESERGRLLTIKPQKKGSLQGLLKTDIKIINYSCADQLHPDTNPRMYFFGFDKRKKRILKAWARTTFCEVKDFKGGFDDLNDQRKECGQKEITTVNRPHRRWPGHYRERGSDSESDFDSDGLEDLITDIKIE